MSLLSNLFGVVGPGYSLMPRFLITSAASLDVAETSTF